MFCDDMKRRITSDRIGHIYLVIQFKTDNPRETKNAVQFLKAIYVQGFVYANL